MAKRSALLIGTTAYDDEKLSPLAAPAEDLKAIASLLSDEHIGAFDVELMLNRQHFEVQAAIASFLFRGEQEDVLLLYYSGHGLLDRDGGLHLCAKNTRRGALLPATAIPSEFVRRRMDECRSTRQVLVLDCCHAGAFNAGAKGADLDTPVDTRGHFAGDGSARVILAATDSTKLAWEGNRFVGDADCSLFTHFLADGLRTGEADRDGNGLITVDELFNYTSEKVRAITPDQTPQIWSFAQTGPLVLARNSRPRPEGSPHFPRPN